MRTAALTLRHSACIKARSKHAIVQESLANCKENESFANWFWCNWLLIYPPENTHKTILVMVLHGMLTLVEHIQ